MRFPLSLVVVSTVAVFFSACGGQTPIKDTIKTVQVEEVVTPEVTTEQIDNTNPLYATVNADSEFVPTQGSSSNPPPASAGERRLLLAYSEDGIHFTPTGQILTDQANVPDAVIEEDGTLRVYYIGQSIENGKEENTAVAISTDNGASWTFRKLTFKNFPQPRDPSDPDVVLLEDGTYRMYYTSSYGDHLGIVYAESDDGITFTYKGECLENTDGKDAVDSNTFFFDGLWHMYVLQEKVQGQLHATSEDGFTFKLTNEGVLRLPLERYIVNNPVIENNQVRMFAFSLAEKNIRSFTTSDLKNWKADDIALEGDDASTLETNYIQDSTIVHLQDGRYIMIYVSALPTLLAP